MSRMSSVLTAQGTGADVMLPMALPIFGGMLFELLTLFVVPLLWSAGLLLLGLHLLNEIAVVNTKCKRLPALVNTLSFGAEIDHDKWCVAAHITSCDAGFFVYNVPVTRGSVLKFSYFLLAGFFFLLTKLVAQSS